MRQRRPSRLLGRIHAISLPPVPSAPSHGAGAIDPLRGLNRVRAISAPSLAAAGLTARCNRGFSWRSPILRSLESVIEKAFDARDAISTATRGEVRDAIERGARPARQGRGARRRAAGRRTLDRQPVAEEGRAALLPAQSDGDHQGRPRRVRLVGQGAVEIRRLGRASNSRRPASAPCPRRSCAAPPISRPASC